MSCQLRISQTMIATHKTSPRNSNESLLGAPGYHLKIKRPMDFGTIRSNLNYMKYKNNQEFVRDVYLVLHNCWLFNPKSSPEFKAAEVLHREVKWLLKEYEIADTMPVNGHSSIMDEL